MKLSEIVASLTELKTTVAAFISDKTRATAEALTNFSTKLSALETGAVTELTQVQADLATAKQTIGTLEKQVESFSAVESGIKTKLDEATTALKLTIAPAATHAEKITALQDAVSTTLAKLNVDPKSIPAGKPGATGKESKTISRAEFGKLNPAAQSEFCKTGGKITE